MKICKGCNEYKPLSEYHNDKSGKEGKTARCKVCRIKAAKKWNVENYDQYRENLERWRKDNVERIKTQQKKYQHQLYYEGGKRKTDSVRHKLTFEKHKKENPQDFVRKCKNLNCCNYYIRKLGGRLYCGDYCFRDNQRRKNREKYHTNPIFKLHTIFRSKINALIREERVSTPKDMRKLGYTWEELKQYLESQFTNDMSWENHGRNGWHIDHIRPVDSFEDTIEDFQKCWALDNLQPLWETDNIQKGNTWDGVVNA